jgi:hypothetical protein
MGGIFLGGACNEVRTSYIRCILNFFSSLLNEAASAPKSKRLSAIQGVIFWGAFLNRLACDGRFFHVRDIHPVFLFGLEMSHAIHANGNDNRLS